MDVIDLVASIYLGDRGCKKITIDNVKNEVSIQIDKISRIRSADGLWNFYNEENITDGELVFIDFNNIKFDKSGKMPNDYIGDFNVTKTTNGNYKFSFSADSVSEDGSSIHVTIQIIAEAFALRDPLSPDKLITD